MNKDQLAAPTSSQLLKVKDLMTYNQIAGLNLSYIYIKDDAQDEELVAASGPMELDDEDQPVAVTPGQPIKV